MRIGPTYATVCFCHRDHGGAVYLVKTQEEASYPQYFSGSEFSNDEAEEDRWPVVVPPPDENGKKAEAEQSLRFPQL